MIVDLGSAVTVDLVSGDGVFMGGTISPGLRSCLDALHFKTSLLPRVDLSPPQNILGVDTEAGILSRRRVRRCWNGGGAGPPYHVVFCWSNPDDFDRGDSAFLSLI